MKNHEDMIIEMAMEYLAKRLREPGAPLQSPSAVVDFLKLNMAQREHEVFGVLFLDNRNAVIRYEEMFRGTIDRGSVYPREVAKAALACNATGVIVAHNHPSQIAEPSRADQLITEKLQEALALLDIRLLDHVVIGGMNHFSFTERGWL